MSHPRPRFSLTPAADGAVEHADPTEANNCLEWIEGMAKIGFTVAVVEVKYSRPELEKAGLGFEERIGSLLQDGELGHFDTMQQGDPFKLFFYLHTKTLSVALQFIKAKLEELGLLSLCKIGHADHEAKVWRVFYPEAHQ